MNDRFANHVPGVLNVGSLNIDRVFRLPHVTRPGETLASSALDVFAGGKGANQSVALARAGAKVSHCGRVGPDGAWLVDKLAAEGVDTRSVKRGDSPTGQAIIQVGDDGQNAIVLLAGANHQITEADIDAALASCAPGTLVLTQNETSGVAHLIKRAAAAGLPVAFNPAPFTPAVLELPLDRVALLIVNESEGEGLTGSNKPGDILSKLRSRLAETGIILTLGADGVLYDDGRERFRVPALAVDAVDTTAAGDTFIGYFLAERLRGTGVKASLETACRAAAISVSRPGATDSIPYQRELADFEPRSRG
jgi:ribokinase